MNRGDTMLVELDYKATLNIPDEEIIDGLNGNYCREKSKIVKEKILRDLNDLFFDINSPIKGELNFLINGEEIK